MNAEILCIGTELVLGDIVNTNATYLSRALAAKGINVFYQSAVGDNSERIVQALAIAVERSELIIFTGGLGPTADDITLEIVTKALGFELEENAEAKRRIIEFFKRIDKPMTENNLKQAYLPKGCVPFQNETGTAPGCALEADEQCIIFLPGPPQEMKAMFEKSVSPYLDKYSNGVIKSKFLHIYGIGESEIDERLADLIAGQNPTVAPYAKTGEVALRVTAKADDKQTAKKMLNDILDELQSRLGNSIYGFDEDTLQQVVVDLLKTKHLKIATAESCTAGYISKRITDISGSSAVFPMGISTYSNESKVNMLDVPKEILDEKGAVSLEVAAAMAKGVRLRSGADIGLSITGIAGPKSDGTDKPVGLSFIGLSTEEGELVIQSNKGGNTEREYIRHASASEALNFARLFLINSLDSLNVTKLNALLGAEIAEKAALAGTTEQALQNENTIVTPKTDENIDSLKNKPSLKKQNLSSKKLNQLKVPSVIIPPQNLENPPEDFDNPDVVSQKVSVDELKSFKKDSDQINKEKNAKETLIKNDYIPVEEEENEHETEVLDQMEKIFSPKPKLKERIFIHKGDTTSEKARKITFWTAILLLVCALAYIGFYFINPIIQNRKSESMASNYHQSSSEDYSSSVINPKFKKLYEQNHDLIGWISIDNTKIDYPVVQSDGDYYLRRAFDGSYSRGGTIFADNNSSIAYNKETKNIVLYGHHMVSDGTMFKDLDKYLKLNFYKKSPTITFDTLYKDGSWKIFSIFLTNATDAPEQDNGKVYNYTKTTFSNDRDFENWINEAYLRSVVDTGVTVSDSDEILTLQTCADTWETNEKKARLIIMARRTLKGEDKSVDTSRATNNENPKYPQVWYDINGVVNPYYYTVANTVIAQNITTQSTNSTAPKSSAVPVSTASTTRAYTQAPTVATTKKTETKKTEKETKKATTKATTKKTTAKHTTNATTVETTQADNIE